MRAGKSTLLTLLSVLVSRPMIASSMTAAVLVRAIAKFRPTVLADEADTWLTDEKSELRGIMNAGHTRHTAKVLRCHPVTLEVQEIPCFAARVIAMIGRPPGTITDRSIAVELYRKRSDEQVERMRVDRLNEAHQPLRSQWRRWASDHLDRMRESDPEMPLALNDRAIDNWRPLVAVADLAGGAWPEWARSAAVELSGVEDSDENITIELLQDIRGAFDGESMLTSAALVQALVEMTERPWAEWGKTGKGLTPVKLRGCSSRSRSRRGRCESARRLQIPTTYPIFTMPGPGIYRATRNTRNNSTNPPQFRRFLKSEHVRISESENAEIINEIGPCSDSSNPKPVLAPLFAHANGGAPDPAVPSVPVPVGGGHARRY